MYEVFNLIHRLNLMMSLLQSPRGSGSHLVQFVIFEEGEKWRRCQRNIHDDLKMFKICWERKIHIYVFQFE